MILRKPYAFLIKHFRIIHFILSLPILYLIIKSTSLVSYFNDYISSGYVATGAIDSLVNIFMYLAIIFIVIALITIAYLMIKKEKPTKFYTAAIIYYLIYFVLLSVLYNELQTIQVATVSSATARTFRDITFIYYLPQFFFFIMSILRGIGFDIKKFNFNKDVMDLEISEKDNEEFEFALGSDGYKFKRRLRKLSREFKYYIKENKFIFCCIILGIGIVIGTSVYMNKEVYNKSYNESQSFSYGQFNIKVNDSHLTSLKYNGEDIGSKYLIVELTVINRGYIQAQLDLKKIYLDIKGDALYPTLDRGEFFIDYATPYKNNYMEINKEYNYLLAFPISEDNVANSYTLSFQNTVDVVKGAIKARTTDINLKPDIVYSVNDPQNFNIKELVSLNNSNLKSTALMINAYDLQDNYVFKYNKCDTVTNCRELYGVITVATSMKSSKMLLLLDASLELDTSTNYYSQFNTNSSFFTNFATIKYQVNGTMYSSVLVNKTTPELESIGKLAFQVDSKISSATYVEMDLTIRNVAYKVILKDS